MKLIISLCLCSSVLNHPAAVPQRWDVDLAAQPPQVFALQRPRGETYELEAVMKDHGKPFAPAITNACIYWQTNGMENLYWSAPASVSNNVLRATWLPSMDPGATTVRGYIGDPGHIYAAAFQFRFIASPGATPNELPLPQKVIDFSKVTVLNPPWSGGGGGGVDTNAVIDIIHETVSGEARPLPKYLHALDFDDSYPDAAEEYYTQRGGAVPAAQCSSVRDGGFLYRNFDYPFDERAEFVVRMSAGIQQPTTSNQQPTHRFASVGVAQVGTNLTEAIVTSGKPEYSARYKWLPGATVDGINENGVVAEINVVDGEPQWGGGVSPALHPLAAVRWTLDNATNAAHAADYLASHIAFPAGWEQNFHWMIADQAQTWIVENGVASNVTAVAAKRVMTNFPIIPDDYSGTGAERYQLLLGGSTITNAWYTRAYRPDTTPPWASEFGGDLDALALATNLWAHAPKEEHRAESFNGTNWWHTVHTSIYDITNRTLRVAVQEQDDWYVFAVDQANVDLSPIEAQIAALQDGKLNKSDVVLASTDAADGAAAEAKTARHIMNRDAYEEQLGPWTHGELPEGFELFGAPEYESSVGLWTWRCVYNEVGDRAYCSGQADSLVLDNWHSPAFPGGRITFTATRTKSFTSSGKLLAADNPLPQSGSLAKFAADGKMVAAEKSSTSADPANADYRDPQDNTCHKTEYGKWVAHTTSHTFVSHQQPYLNGGLWLWQDDYGAIYSADGDSSSIELEFSEPGLPERFTATRSAVCTDGKRFVTEDVVDGKVSAAVSTNNPAFVSAVRDTPTSGMPEDMPTDWGTYGTVGAALAALAAFVKWANAKIVAVIGNDGKPTDTFATDLLGKQVANVKANTASLAAAYSETATYSVGDAVTHNGKLYKCAVAITTAEAWTPAHWTETTVATLWNDADTTSYGGQN